MSITEQDAQVSITDGYTLTAVTTLNTSIQWYDISSGGPVALFAENSTTLNVPVATYYYILTVDEGGDEEQIFNGSVTLVR